MFRWLSDHIGATQRLTCCNFSEMVLIGPRVDHLGTRPQRRATNGPWRQTTIRMVSHLFSWPSEHHETIRWAPWHDFSEVVLADRLQPQMDHLCHARLLHALQSARSRCATQPCRLTHAEHEMQLAREDRTDMVST